MQFENAGARQLAETVVSIGQRRAPLGVARTTVAGNRAPTGTGFRPTVGGRASVPRRRAVRIGERVLAPARWQRASVCYRGSGSRCGGGGGARWRDARREIRPVASARRRRAGRRPRPGAARSGGKRGGNPEPPPRSSPATRGPGRRALPLPIREPACAPRRARAASRPWPPARRRRPARRPAGSRPRPRDPEKAREERRALWERLGANSRAGTGFAHLLETAAPPSPGGADAEKFERSETAKRRGSGRGASGTRQRRVSRATLRLGFTAHREKYEGAAAGAGGGDGARRGAGSSVAEGAPREGGVRAVRARGLHDGTLQRDAVVRVLVPRGGALAPPPAARRGRRERRKRAWARKKQKRAKNFRNAP